MATLRGTPDDDTLRGTSGADEIRGRRGHDLIWGGAGKDRLWGGAGDDEIRGGRGHDQIGGGEGDDRLWGGAGNDWLSGQARANILTGGRGADTFAFTAASEGRDTISDFSPDEGDTLEMRGPLAGAAIRMVDGGASTTVQVKPADADAFSDLVILQDYRQPIDVWHGDHQQFGSPGEAQRWINVLGNVGTPGLTSLTYALNGGPEEALAAGPNGNRLEAPGDFNIELDYSQLDPSPIDDVVTIRAAFSNGQVFDRDVTIDYEGGRRWAADYDIDWATVSDLQHVVQVVDGHWSFDADGVRPAVIGYDRLLVMGDVTWDSYEVRLSFTPHDLSQTQTGLGGAIWLGMQWGGHTDVPFGGQPHGGYIPGATFMLNHGAVVLRPSEFFESETNPRVAQGLSIVEDQTYNVLIRNQAVASDTDLGDGLDRTYSIRVWGAGDSEPADWAISHTMFDQEPFGSFYLNAHHVDVTFGDIAFTPLPGSDLLQSQDDLPALLAANFEDTPSIAPAATIASGNGSSEARGTIPNLSDLVVSGDDAIVAA